MARSSIYIDPDKSLSELKPRIVEYLTTSGFSNIDYDSEKDVFQKGNGIMSAALFIALKEVPGKNQLDAWVRNGFGKSESGLNSPIGTLPKNNLKKHLSEIEALI